MGWFCNGKCTSNARLDGKTVIITGSNTGIGKVAALELIQRGAKVIIACRNIEKGEVAKLEIMKDLEGKEGIGHALVRRLDLSSFASVREFSKETLENEPSIHILINNAGVMMCPYSLTEDGYEMQFGTNHLGHFLLTLLLLPKMISSAPARIINVSSKAHVITSSISFDDINSEKGYSSLKAYGRSKLANILFTRELAKRLEGTKVTAYSLHPGVVDTELTRHMDSTVMRGFDWFYHKLGGPFLKTPLQGAQTTLYCALEESLSEKSGGYYDDCKESSLTSAALDDDLAKQLWEKSIEYVQLKSDELFYA